MKQRLQISTKEDVIILKFTKAIGEYRWHLKVHLKKGSGIYLATIDKLINRKEFNSYSIAGKWVNNFYRVTHFNGGSFTFTIGPRHIKRLTEAVAIMEFLE